MIAPEREAGNSAVRRYRPSRPWPVGGLALIAAAGAVLAAGTLSSVLDGGSAPAFAAKVGQSVASARLGMEAHAAAPVARAPIPSSRPPSTGVWQVQVGAFRTAQAAEAHLRAVKSEVPEVAHLSGSNQVRAGLNRVRIGAIEDEAGARELCRHIVAAGRGCFVVGPES